MCFSITGRLLAVDKGLGKGGPILAKRKSSHGYGTYASCWEPSSMLFSSAIGLQPNVFQAAKFSYV